MFPLDNQNKPCSQTILIIAGWPEELKKFASGEIPGGEQRRGMVVFTSKLGTILDRVSYTTPKPAIDISLENLVVSVPSYRMPRIGETARGGGIEMRVSSIGSVEKPEKEYGKDPQYFNLIWTETAKEGYELVVLD